MYKCLSIQPFRVLCNFHTTHTHTLTHTLTHTHTHTHIHRQIDTREPHTCSGDGSCRNVLIDLNLTCRGGSAGSTQFKCIDINPVRPEQIAVGALDAFVRVYDSRILSLRSMAKDLSGHGDPSCLAHFAPGHIANPASKRIRKSSSALASTYVTYSPDGSELLVNLSGEHIYLFDTNCFTESLKYDFDKNDEESVPVLRPHSYTSTYTPPPIHHTRSVFHTPQKTILPLPKRELSNADVGVDVEGLKETGHDFIKAGMYSQAVDCFSQAIAVCPTWHVLYSMRAAALYSRRW